MTDAASAVRNVFPKKKVVIIGDLVADQFLNGTISRVSREAPVFILRHDDTSTVPGAAANAAVNVVSLGAAAVIIGVVGDDPDGAALLDKMKAAGVDCSSVVKAPHLRTTTKVRVLAGQNYAARQQVIRIDYENSSGLGDAAKASLRDNLDRILPDADAVIISDYGYGAVFPELAADAMAHAKAREIPVIVDSRYSLESLAHATTATPNREEVENILGRDFTIADCSRLRSSLGLDALLITNGNKGMSLFERDKEPLHIRAVGPTEPVDVTGAGDTVIAAYSLGLACDLSFPDAAMLANHAGGIVVMKKGTASVSSDELLASISSAAITGSSHA